MWAVERMQHTGDLMAGAAEDDCSKGGQLNLTRTLALELAELRISANDIGPGMVLTPA
jgi:NAD(P)-dependent dehydrogenase (short-subunit alcohol dehydrogenase family)